MAFELSEQKPEVTNILVDKKISLLNLSGRRVRCYKNIKNHIICEKFEDFQVAIPKTNKLELFALLKETKENGLLLREMMSEFLTNFNDMPVFADEGKLYQKVVYKKRF